MPYTFRQGDLPKLDLQVDRGSDFKAWKAQWQAYYSLSGLSRETAATQVQALTLCFSRETIPIVENLGLSLAQRGSVASVIKAIEDYVQGQINETVERRNFRKRVQQPGESFDDFLVSLRELVKTCSFCDGACERKSIRDQIIEGILDGEMTEDLLRAKDLTLDTAISKCRAHEAARRHRVEITSMNTPNSASIQAIKRPAPYPGTSTQSAPTTCPGCGSPFHPGGRKSCPAYKVACHHCNKLGHFSRVCKSRQRNPLPTAITPNEPRSHLIRIEPATIHPPSILSNNITEPAPTINVHVSALNGSAPMVALPDSGADISVAGPDTVTALGDHCQNLLPSDMTPRGVTGHRMMPLGQIPVTITLGAVTYTDALHIYPEVKGVLLSWKTSKALRVLPTNYPSPLSSLDTPLISATTTQEGTTPSLDPAKEFPTVFDGNITQMDGEHFHITLTDGAKPFCIKTPRTVPFAYRDKLKAELEILETQGIIAPVTYPTEWCAPIVVTPKKDSDNIRMCVDLSHLNKYIKRERYQSPTPAQAVADITSDNATIFTKLDAMKGYHQCPLDEASQDLTTFLTPFGRFKYLRAPYGISSISEHYNRRMDEAFSGLLGYRRIVDDIVIYDSDPTKHADHVRQFLQRCKEQKITLNTSKWAFGQPTVTFAGFILSKEGYQIDPAITRAIANFPTPSTRTELRSFIGLVNQLSSSTSAIAHFLSPFRPLLSTKNEFTWSDEFQSAFKAVKTSLTSPPVVSYFDPAKPTRLCTDASRQGLGFVLQQKHGDTWRLIQAGSRFLSDAESRYAIIELELLAVTWAISKCNIFLAGLQHFHVITDHHPLIPILNNHRLDEIENPRLQRMKAKLMEFNFTTEWLKGTLNQVPDALSRNPTNNPEPHETLAESDLDYHQAPTAAAIRVVTTPPTDNLRLQNLREIAKDDQDYQTLKHYIANGFPEHRKELPDSCKPYWSSRTHLSIEDDLIVYGCRLLIPAQMRRAVLQQLHDSHQGLVWIKERAQLIVFWPNISHDIDNVVSSCKMCQDRLPSHPKEPLVMKPQPSRPFQEVAADFCTYAGNEYLIVVDCLSDWPEIIPMYHNTRASRLTSALRAIFCRTGVPDTVWSDQGPQFTSKIFQDFAAQWGFRHATSSPRYPQSNGKAESTVRSMKKLIQAAWTGRHLDEDKLTRGLLQYRNTPTRKDGRSPAQKLYGNPIQDTLPAHRRSFAVEWQLQSAEADKKLDNTNAAMERSYNQHARPLPDISAGTSVAIQDQSTKRWDVYGTVIDIGPNRRYFVKTQSGRVLVRNRRFLRKRVPLSLVPAQPRAPSPLPNRTEPVQPPPSHRRSSRKRAPAKRLIEEMTTFQVDQQSAPRGGRGM